MLKRSTSAFSLSFVLILISYCTSFSQSNIAGIDKFDFFKNLFFIGDRAYNIETLKEVTTEIKPGYVKIFDNSNTLGVYVKDSRSNNKVLFYNDGKQKIGEIILDKNQVLSPNFDYVLSIKERDYWVQKIENHKSLGSQKQLTNLGAFERIQYAQWYGQSIYPVINWQGGVYNLNASNGKIEKAINIPAKRLANYENSADEVSPSGRYIIGSKDFFSFYVYDSQKGMVISNSQKFPERLNIEAPIWISNREFLMLGIQMGSRPVINGYKYKITNENKTELVREFKNINSVGFNKATLQQVSLFDKFRGISRCISLDGQYMITPKIRQSDNFFDIALVNLRSGKNEIIFSNNSNNKLNQNSIINITRNPLFRWVSAKSFIYTTKGDLLTQGTWMFDIESKEVKKVSPFVSEEFWVFEEAGYVLFKANGKLFRSDSNGDKPTEIKGGNLYGKVQKLFK